ncbi:MAG: hypothetical protein ACUVT2_10135, partial [Thiobacillaceae bacterium]
AIFPYYGVVVSAKDCRPTPARHAHTVVGRHCHAAGWWCRQGIADLRPTGHANNAVGRHSHAAGQGARRRVVVSARDCRPTPARRLLRW